MAVVVERRRFTVDEYYRMAEAGILTEDDRVELLEGEVLQMPPIGSHHAGCVGRLTHILTSHLGNRAIVWVQNPVRLDAYNEPQPDATLLRTRDDFYTTGYPGPGDVLLIVEVAETTAAYDRSLKVPLYARFGIREVWLVDLNTETVEVYRGPSSGGYQDVRRLGRGETLSPTAFPDVAIPVDAVLG